MSSANARHNLPPEIERALLDRLSGSPPREPPRRGPADARRLPAVQHRIWVMDRLDEGKPINTVSLAVRLRGRLDRRALAHAAESVVAAHAELRTIVAERDGVPEARTLPSVAVPVEETDLGAGTSLEETLADLAGRPLDPATGSNVRVQLITVGPADHVVLLLVHHLVCDAASMGILMRDLGRAYAGRPLSPPAHRYADLAELTERQAARTRARDLAYWRETLSGVPATLDLDCARARPLPHSAQRGAVDILPLPAGLIDAAAGLGLAHGAPLSSVLLAAWVSVLRRHSAQDDIVVGTAVDERNTPGAEEVVGPFVNLVPLRVRCGPVASRDDLVTAARDALLGALDHAALEFERLVAAVRPPRPPGRHPLFQATFDLRRELPRPWRFGDLQAEPIPMPIAPARVDLGLSIDRTAGGWQARLVSSTGLFAPGTGHRLVRDLAEALHSLVSPPPRPVAPPAAPVPSGSVLEAIDRWAGRRPDAVAVEDGRRALSYGELTSRSRALAGRLADVGAGPGIPVGVLMNRDCDLVTGLLGVLRAGSPYLPLDPDHPRARTRALLADAGARILLTTPELAGYAPAGVRVVTPGDEGAGEVSAAARPGHLAYVIYTSGSTGPPKGVEITHQGLATILHAMGELIDVSPDDALLAITTVAFDIAALELFLPLTRGGRVVLAPSGAAADPELIRALAAAHGVTILQATPVTWRVLGPGPIPGLRVALCGGDRLPADLAPRIAGMAESAWNVYGPTEATIWTTAHRLDHSGEPVPIGRPLPGTRAYVLDHDLRPVLPGNPGELCLAGAGLARGYRGRPGLTAERFPPDPHARGERLYRTGDRARLRDDGTLHYLGRLDEQLKIRGLRIEPGEIEAAVRELPGIEDAAVTAVAGPAGEPVLTCYVVGESGMATAELRAALRERLPAHLVPGTFVVLDALPLTPNGKLDRRALPAPAPAPARFAHTGPRGEVEQVIREVWQEVLGRSPVHAHEDFFDLGGHSLLAARVAARLRTRLDVDVPLRLLLDHPTVAATARALHGLGPAEVPPVGPARHDHDEAAPLTVAQHQVWLLCQDPQAGLAYHVHAVLPVPDHVATLRLRAALDELTRRHCVLRTRYPMVDGEPRQVADGPPSADLTETSVRASELPAFLATAAREPFAPAEAPPVRWLLARDRDGPALLALVAHHLALDGWSLALLERELAALLDGADLPPAPCFGAIARWQRRCLASAELERQRGYWRERLAAPRPVTAPPYDRVPSPRPDFRGDVVRTSVTPAVADLARSLHATPFMTLLAAFLVELRRGGAGDDLLVGVPMAARRLEELEGAVGMLVNTVALRCDLSGGPSFAEVVGRVRRAVLEAHTHQELPLAEVVREIGAMPGASRNPLYRTMFGMDGIGLGHRVHNGAAKLDLTVMMAPEPDAAGWAISWEYATQVLDTATVTAMAGRYGELVSAACRDPHRPIAGFAPVVPRSPSPPSRRRTVQAGPPTPLEPIVSETYAAVLGVTAVGRDDDFFELGGHSLLALRAADALSARTGRPVTSRLLMAHPTVAALARALSAATAPLPASARGHGPVVLVTGATGLVGQAVTAELRRRGMAVRAFSRPSSRTRALRIADEVAEGDLADPSTLAEAADGAVALVHAACTFTEPDVDLAAMETLAARRSGRPFVFISSADVYGRPPGPSAVAEDHPLSPDVTEYARAKAACEALLAATGPGHAELRPPFVWAPDPYCMWQLRQTAGAPVEDAVRSGRPLVLPPARRGHAWVDARDLAWLVAECLRRPPDGPVNAVGGHFGWRTLAMELLRLRGLRIAMEEGEPSGLYATHRRFSGALAAGRWGFSPRRRWARTLAAAARGAAPAEAARP
ncbi:amino acid adenylation domain-containing protein [Nonomuraea sp. NPDC050394]|uniref:amino acid adenylation domain-containing protein n=1 Tax=Nonomuraea sp. NPDC050394 TaxID=3364363 RepID=UPI00379F5A06